MTINIFKILFCELKRDINLEKTTPINLPKVEEKHFESFNFNAAFIIWELKFLTVFVLCSRGQDLSCVLFDH